MKSNTTVQWAAGAKRTRVSKRDEIVQECLLNIEKNSIPEVEVANLWFWFTDIDAIKYLDMKIVIS